MRTADEEAYAEYGANAEGELEVNMVTPNKPAKRAGSSMANTMKKARSDAVANDDYAKFMANAMYVAQQQYSNAAGGMPPGGED